MHLQRWWGRNQVSFPGFFPLLNDDVQGLLSHEVRKPQRLLHVDKIISRDGKNVRSVQGSDNSADIIIITSQGLCSRYITCQFQPWSSLKWMSHHKSKLTSQFLGYNYLFMLRFKKTQGIKRTSKHHTSHLEPFSPGSICRKTSHRSGHFPCLNQTVGH